MESRFSVALFFCVYLSTRSRRKENKDNNLIECLHLFSRSRFRIKIRVERRIRRIDLMICFDIAIFFYDSLIFYAVLIHNITSFNKR